MTEISPSTVFVSSVELRSFAQTWPCSGLRDIEAAVAFGFDVRGNLVEVSWFDGETGTDINEPEGIDQYALLAISQDAGNWLITQQSN